MFTKLAITSAMLATLTLPALAQGYGPWIVLQDAGETECYVANRAPGPFEVQLSGLFDSEAGAEFALGQIARCMPVNVQPGKDSSASTP